RTLVATPIEFAGWIPVLLADPRNRHRNIKAFPFSVHIQTKRETRHGIPDTLNVSVVFQGIVSLIDFAIAVQIQVFDIASTQMAPLAVLHNVENIIVHLPKVYTRRGIIPVIKGFLISQRFFVRLELSVNTVAPD